jgi:2,3,4,5-tetrahydropyridine-2-carboxylate N-succinyltransferase
MEYAEMERAIERLASGEGDVRGQDGTIVDDVIALLDDGTLRVAARDESGTWRVNAWVKQAILLYFRRRSVEWIGEPGRGIAFYDKLPLKTNFARTGARCVPPGVARYGSYLGKNAILMPGYVNIGAYVDDETMVDTWATVGSCAQIGKGVHIAGGVGIGGVLEPPQSAPVIVEDGAFIGSRCIVVEGVRIGKEAVLGAGVVLTASTPIVDVRGNQAQTSRGSIAERAVVIPGSIPKRFPAGDFGTPCALVIGTRSESTDEKVSLERTLREYNVAV